jgi:dipeptidyl aminopeptidase/acylaminoacyl peptidase
MHLLAAYSWSAGSKPAPAPAGKLPPLIPREVMFGAPSRTQATISPDGLHYAWMAPDTEHVVNVFVAPVDSPEGAKAVTNERHNPVLTYRWALDSQHLLYLQDSAGDENEHLYAADLAGKNVRDLTPFRGVKAQGLHISPRRPNEVLVGLNLDDRAVFDLYRIDLTSGALTLDCRASEAVDDPDTDILSFTPDADLTTRAVTTFSRKSYRTSVRVRDDAKSPWRELISWPFEQTPVYYGQAYGSTMVVNFSPDGKSINVISSAHSDTAQVVSLDVATGAQRSVLASDPHADPMWGMEDITIPMYLTDPTTTALQAVAFEYTEPQWKFIDQAFANSYATLNRQLPGFLVIVSRDANDQKWIVTPRRADAPDSYFLFDRKSGTVTKLFDSRPELAKYQLATTEPVVIRSREGLDLVTYVVYPAGVERKNLPLMVWAHGGPWARDSYEYSDLFQFFANRGYAVMAVNYRGSEGFGRKFVNAFTGQFGTGTQNDILDAVQWAVRKGIADPKRIAIGGSSGGGYATLRALTDTPAVFRAGIDSAGPSDVKLMIESFPPYWGPSRVRFIRRIGDVINDEQLNRRISPLYHVENIRVPLLVVQGANDPVVPIATADRLVRTLREKGLAPTYVVYPDEGHGCCTRPENAIDMAVRVEEFLAKNLGGRQEPPKKIEGTSAELR